ncbi:MAG TPA: universal stress protein [Armatimonadota bacterium]|nr:universal stress protein [Armatimonadota bacterium]
MYKQILIPLDGSELAEGAISHAMEIAKAFKAKVTLLSVVEPVAVYPQPGAVGPVVSVSMDVQDEVGKVAEYLDGVADKLRQEGIDVLRVVREGDPAGQIVDYAHLNQVDLIVMSTHGRSGIQRLVYGSVAEHVLHHATVPILLVRVITKD